MFLFTQWIFTCWQSTIQTPVQRQLIWRTYTAVNDVVLVSLSLAMNSFVIHVLHVSVIPFSGVSIVDLQQVDAQCLGCDYKKQQVTINNKNFFLQTSKPDTKFEIKIFLVLWQVIFKTKMASNLPINYLATLMARPCLIHSLNWWKKWFVDLRKVTFLGIFCWKSI